MMNRRESDVLASVLALLKARGIFALRMNVGGVRASYRGKERYVRFGVKGMADVLALRKLTGGRGTSGRWIENMKPSPIWIECKAGRNKQSSAQSEFQALVEAEGHSYLTVRSAAELETWLRERGI